MDSDIDIEEHNLFENPELRVLFPDITALKQEIYDENIEVSNIQNCDQTTPKGRPTVGTVEDSQHNDILLYQKRALKKGYANGLTTSDCLFKNKIIIGSKPKHSPTSTYNYSIKHNISRQVKIILSDLTSVLSNSNRFCKVCSILFPNKVNLTDHRNSIHGEKYICNNCGNNFYQHCNLTRHLKNVHKINVIQRKRIIKSATNVQAHITQDQIKESSKDIVVLPTIACFHCTKKFKSKQLLIEHLYTVLEPKVKKQANLQQKAKSKESDDKISKKNGTVSPKIQKTVSKNSSAYRKMPKRSVNNNETELFFKCHKCLHYFKNEDFFIKHMKIKHHTQDFPIKRVPFNTKCDLCTQYCSNARLYNHHIHNHQLISMKKLKRKKAKSKFKKKRVYAKKDTKNTRLNISIRMQKLAQIESLKNNLPNTNLHLYYCKTCKCCVTQIRNIHRQSLCAKLIKHACIYCGLTLTNKGIMGHRSIHHKNPTIKLQDFALYDLETGKKISPPLPEFQKCEGCNKHLFNKKNLNKHLCGEDADFICQICDMKCSEIVYKLHLPFHDYELNETDINKMNMKGIGTSKDNGNVDSPIEYQGNANSAVDNDEYFCKICLIQFDSYDKVIEHCQLHILNTRAPNQNIEHLKRDINSQDIIDGRKVYYFEPYCYGSKDDIWLKHIFNGLSPEEITKKLFHSIYRYESRIKLEIYQEGSPEYTEYKCMKCQCFIENSTLFSHVDGCDPSHLKNYSCIVCKNMYVSQFALSQHMQMHKNLFDMENIRIVYFNQYNDKQINELIKLNPSRPHFVLYRCRNCEGLVNKTKFLKHVCNLNDLQRCNHCGLLLYSSDYESHLLKHKNLDSFTGSNMKVILLGDRIPGFKKSTTMRTSFMGIVYDYSFYRCIKCNVCVRYTRCISKHFCLVDSAKAKCDLCDLYFDQGKLKAHMKLHSEDPEFVKSNIITLVFNPKESEDDTSKAEHKLSRCTKTSVVKITEQDVSDTNGQIVLYRCAKCNLHYMSKSQASEHIKKSPGRVIKQYCTKCGIPFSPNILFDHLVKHHTHTKDIKTTYVIDVFGVYKKRKIFRCANCNLHFTNEKKTFEHYFKCLGDSSEGEKCKCCGLMFHYSYLLNHENSSEYNMHTDYEVVQVDNEYITNEASS